MKSRYPSLDAALCDPARINVLFSPFRSRALNPDHYEEKMKFWVRTIDEMSTIDKRICLTVTDMENAFIAENNQKPVCLLQVLSNLIRDRKAVRKDVYLSSLRASKENSTWFWWSINQIQWVARKLWSYTPVPILNKIENDTPVVYLRQIQVQEKLIQNISALRNKILSLEEWKSEVTSKTGLTEDLDIMVEYLTTSGNLLVDFVGQTEIAKLVVPKLEHKHESITVIEKGQYDIRRTIEILEKDLELLYAKQKEAETQARIALREGRRNTAKSHIRAKKLAEKRTDKLNIILDNLTAISVQVDDATTDSKVLAAYEAGKKILDKVLDENGLTVDSIADAMLNVQDALDRQDEISNSLAQPLVDENVAELEKALEQLLEEDKNVHAKNKAVSKEILDNSSGMDQSEGNLLSKLNDLSLKGLDGLDKLAEPETS